MSAWPNYDDDTPVIWSSSPANPPQSPPPMEPKPALASQPTLPIMDMLKGLRNGQFSDFVIKCGSDEHKVHKAIISTRSSFFEKVCFSPFEESSQSAIHLKEDQPLAVKAMVEWFYLDNYMNMEIPPSPSVDLSIPVDESFHLQRLPLHAQVYVLADKYDIRGLRHAASRNLRGSLADACHRISSPSFHETVKTVYENTLPKSSIRKVIVNVIASNKECMVEKDVRTMILSHAELADEVMRKIGSGMDGADSPCFARCMLCQEEVSSAYIGKILKPGGTYLLPMISGQDCYGLWSDNGKHEWKIIEGHSKGYTIRLLRADANWVVQSPENYGSESTGDEQIEIDSHSSGVHDDEENELPMGGW